MTTAVITILGSGTSTGVPVPACNCDVCISPDPKNKRLRTSALVSLEDGSNIIIDTGPDLRQQLLKEKAKRIDAVLYTHDHADHTAGIDDLRGFCFIQGSAIPCAANAKTINDLTNRFSYIFSPDPNYLGAPVPKINLLQVNAGQEFPLAKILWTPVELVHGGTMVYGYRSGNFAYCTDCNHISPESRELLKGVETLVITGLRFEKHATHYTIPDAIEVARDLGAKKIILVHMTHSIDHQTVQDTLPKDVSLAFDGMKFTVQLQSQ